MTGRNPNDTSARMYRQLRIAVVIPAYNEERAIAAAVAKVPDYVDHVVVIDDCSNDETWERAREAAEARGGEFAVIRHAKNRGVGAAIVSGYRDALEHGCDVVAVMAGDG